MSRLDRVTTGKVQKPSRIVLMGSPGVGKTTFAANAPKPLVLATEDGANDIDVPRISGFESYADFEGTLDELLNTEHAYRTVVIDGLDALERLIFAHVCKKNQCESIESLGYGRGYVLALDVHQRVTNRLDRLRDKGVGSILIAHSGIRTFQPPEGQGYDRHEMRIHKAAGAHYFGWSDAFLFAKFEVFANKEKGALKAKGVSSGERILLTEYSATHDAKNRFGIPPQIPFSYEEYRSARIAAEGVASGKVPVENK